MLPIAFTSSASFGFVRRIHLFQSASDQQPAASSKAKATNTNQLAATAVNEHWQRAIIALTVQWWGNTSILLLLLLLLLVLPVAGDATIYLPLDCASARLRDEAQMCVGPRVGKRAVRWLV